MTTSSLAQVAKLVDAGDSKSPAARCVGSSPTLGTTLKTQPHFRAVFFTSTTVPQRQPRSPPLKAYRPIPLIPFTAFLSIIVQYRLLESTTNLRYFLRYFKNTPEKIP